MAVSEATEFRSCVKVEVAVLGSPSIAVRQTSVVNFSLRVQELCESRGGRPNSLYSLRGGKAVLNMNLFPQSSGAV